MQAPSAAPDDSIATLAQCGRQRGGEDFGDGLTAREVAYLTSEEWARTAHDVLWRRTKTGLHLSPDDRLRAADRIQARHTRRDVLLRLHERASAAELKPQYISDTLAFLESGAGTAGAQFMATRSMVPSPASALAASQIPLPPDLVKTYPARH